MTIYEILSLTLSGGMLLLALLTYLDDRKRK
ncbi:MAG: putative holin-like toxin [Lachnospiraceae bacterium]|nr:putative holin-like toxin [Lachnospiraceae bacterium]